MAVTQKDIAEKLNLSTSLVGHVLNNRRRGVWISDARRAQILTAASEMGYRPNHAARALATGRTNMVALWAPIPYRSFFTLFMRSVQSIARADGFRMIVDETFPDGPEGFSAETSWPVDRIIAVTSSQRVEEFLRSGSPLPLVNVHFGDQEIGDVIRCDLFEGSRRATEYLIGRGRRRTAFLGHNAGEDMPDARGRGYLAAMREAGLKLELINVTPNDRAGAAMSLDAYLSTHRPPEALFCGDDDIATGALKALTRRRIRVPDDVALMGCCGVEDTEYQNPPISTVVVPVDAICERAWEFLTVRTAEPDAPQQTAIFQTHLEIRSST